MFIKSTKGKRNKRTKKPSTRKILIVKTIDYLASVYIIVASKMNNSVCK